MNMAFSNLNEKYFSVCQRFFKNMESMSLELHLISKLSDESSIGMTVCLMRIQNINGRNES
jgi:hypothetical protein